MLDFEACRIAGEMLRATGFEHSHTSMKSEATYYKWPGRNEAIRVACHKAKRSELNGTPVIATITFNELNFSPDKAGHRHIRRDFVINLVAGAIGRYFLVVGGAIKARVRCRDYHPGLDTELESVAALHED